MRKLPIVILIGLLLLVGVASAVITNATTTTGSYTIERFNGTGTVNWSIPSGVVSIQYLIVAGGGAGGGTSAGNAAGGGAGGLLQGNMTVLPGYQLNVTVGEGGSNATAAARGGKGGNSSLANLTGTLTADGGGGGGMYSADGSLQTGLNGGSGGGAGQSQGVAKSGGTATAGQGYAGGATDTTQYAGSGGGGAGEVGGIGTSTNRGIGGKGGNGTLMMITGIATYFAGGGSGSTHETYTSGNPGGGYGGGGTGRYKYNATAFINATQGLDGTGGGGGGGGTVYLGAMGGSGTVILRYITPGFYPNFTCTPLAVNTSNTVTCTDYTTSSAGNIYTPTTWNWSFGDGIYSDLQNPAIVYSDNGVYDVNLTVYNATGGYASYVRSSYITVSESGGSSNFTLQDIQMETTYSMSISFYDSVTLLPIPTVMVIDSLGGNTSTTVGVFAGTYNYSTVVFYYISTGYVSKAISYVIDEDRLEVVYLTPESAVINTGGNTSASVQHQVSYAAHLVRFRAVDYTGRPIDGMNVTTVVVESSSPWAWITDILGIDLGTVEISNTTMMGYTGDDGAIVFLMIENLQYRLDFEKPSESISEHMFVYPKETDYEYVFWTEEAPRSIADINIHFWNQTNSTDPLYMDLGIYYDDTGSSTDHLFFTVKNETGEIMFNTSSSTPNNWNVSYPVLVERGAAFVWKITGNSTAYANPIVQSNTIRFGGSPKIIGFDLGQPWNTWISIGIIFIVAMLFGRASIKYAAAIVPLLALFFWYVNMLWLPGEYGYMIAIIVFFGVLFYIRYAEQESDI